MNEQLVGPLAIQRSDLFRSPAILRRYCRRHATTRFYSPRQRRKKSRRLGGRQTPRLEPTVVPNNWRRIAIPRGATREGLSEDQINQGSVAEREGFEPPIPLRVCRISSAVLSTTQPPLRSPDLYKYFGQAQVLDLVDATEIATETS